MGEGEASWIVDDPAGESPALAVEYQELVGIDPLALLRAAKALYEARSILPDFHAECAPEPLWADLGRALRPTR